MRKNVATLYLHCIRINISRILKYIIEMNIPEESYCADSYNPVYKTIKVEKRILMHKKCAGELGWANFVLLYIPRTGAT